VTITPFSSFQFNQCAGGEFIEISGKQVIATRSVEKHIVAHITLADAKAVAPSPGAKYVVVTRSGNAFYGQA